VDAAPIAHASPDTDVELPLEAEAWLTHLVVERGRSPRTVAAYRADLLRWCRWLAARGVAPLAAGAGDVADYAAELRSGALAASSSTRMLVSVRGLYRHLCAEGAMAVDPTADLESARRPDPLPKALSEEEVDRLLEATAAAAAGDDPVAVRDLALLELLYGTGARVSEACGLGFGDIDLEAGLVRLFGKRSKERVVPIGRAASAAMARWIEVGRPALVATATLRRDDADAVFLGVRLRRLSRQAAWQVIRGRAGEAGLRVGSMSPHVLRHSCATHLLDHGADIRTVAELLGHASVSTTQVYTRVANERLVEAYRSAHPRATRRPAAAPGP
jgi:integrase/recombinase XerD